MLDKIIRLDKSPLQQSSASDGNLTRQQEVLLKYQHRLKYSCTLLEQVFPEYTGVFGSLYSKVSLLTLLAFPNSEAVLKVREKEITNNSIAMYESFR